MDHKDLELNSTKYRYVVRFVLLNRAIWGHITLGLEMILSANLKQVSIAVS